MDECAREEENALYTSTSFFVWLRCLKGVRGLLWVGAALGSLLAASQILRGNPELKIWMAGAALLAVALPAIGRAVHIDTMIRDYSNAAAAFKNLQGEFRRARLVWSNEPWTDFRVEGRRLFKSMNDARKPSLTPPEWCFYLARRKIKAGHYDHDADGTSGTAAS
jgi:hypothetical protein